jgi:hypothetical protein
MDMQDPSSTPQGAGVPESLEAVRDILFGAQMRSVESRLQAMEERLLREQNQLRTDLVRKIDDLESRTRDEFRAASERMTADRARGSEETRSLGAELTQAHRDLEQRHLRLQEATSLADAEIRDQLLMHASATSTEFARTRQALTTDIAGKHQELMTKKTDRVALARLLSEVAKRLDDPGVGSGPDSDADTQG